jgi:hypothetical protein
MACASFELESIPRVNLASINFIPTDPDEANAQVNEREKKRKLATEEKWRLDCKNRLEKEQLDEKNRINGDLIAKLGVMGFLYALSILCSLFESPESSLTWVTSSLKWLAIFGSCLLGFDYFYVRVLDSDSVWNRPIR